MVLLQKHADATANANVTTEVSGDVRNLRAAILEV